MKKHISFITAMVGSLSFSGFTMAECPNNLPVNEIVDCIVVEGAGDIHQKSEFNKPESGNKTEKISNTEARPDKKQLAKKEK